ncbi:MAG: tRNA (N(6)-L-threonylcarbamoyladenosine(37)-C(2))-methylthiotransferase [Candidatus Woesearchaeota archaeon]
MKVFIKTFGCSLNRADSETMAYLLEKAGFSLVNSEEQAEIVVVNTCCVKAPTEDKVVHYVKKLEKYVVVTGCIPQVLPERLAGYTMLGTTQQRHIVEAVEETVNGNTLVMLTPEEVPFESGIAHNPVIEIVPIARGCLGNCSYCIVKKTRGELKSYAPEDIIKRIRRTRTKQVWLTAQDTGCYGLDIGTSLPELLDKVTRIPGNFLVRLGMLNPHYAWQYIEGLSRAFESGKLYQFIHIPVQSGNDEVLGLMNRNYTRDLFIRLVSGLRERFPAMTIATDVICGYPGETPEAFNDTLDMINKTKPEVVNISRYWPRKGTEGIDDPEIARDRSRRMKSMVEWTSYEAHKRWSKWKGTILIDEHGKDDSSIGHNYAYRPVIVEGRYPLGTRLNVQVVQFTQHDLRAKVISEVRGGVLAYKLDS